jgi:RimJ/RimL family protein N-acetyltransferase
VWLWVVEGNHRAQRFYRRHGFTPDGADDDHRLHVWGLDLGFDLHVVRFTRDLQPHGEGPAQDQGEP